MKITRRQLKRIIREEYSKLKRKGLINESPMRGDQEACIQQCLAAIPGNMRKICSMGMGHMVINDVYHICEPICAEWGCNADTVSEIVHDMLCEGRG